MDNLQYRNLSTPSLKSGIALAAASLMLLGLLWSPLGVHAATTQSQLGVASQNTSGTTISGYYTVLLQGANSVATGFTPASFTLTNGQAYTLQVDDYGSCHFDHWVDTSSKVASRSITISANTQVTAVYNCGTVGGGSSLTVSSVDQNGNAVSGYYVALQSAGKTVGTGFTTTTFATTSGQVYTIEADGYATCTFAKWSDGMTSNPRSFTASASALALTVVYNCGTSGGGGGKDTTITISANRVPASYWAPCFALTCSLGTGPGASMYVVLYNSAGTVVATGFADENGYTFTGLTPGATYSVYPSDCDLCHGSTHDVLFNHWGDNSTTRPLKVTPGATVAAWYICTNGCGGV